MAWTRSACRISHPISRYAGARTAPRSSTSARAGRVAQVAADYEHLIIDTGPEQEHLVRQALMVTDQLIVPLAPSPIEVDRLGATLTLAAEAEDLGASLDIRLLLTRVRPGTRSASSVRSRLQELELPMLASEVRLLERYAQAHGRPAPADLDDYQAVLEELRHAGVTA